MSKKKIKVTDKRLFTLDGELREDLPPPEEKSGDERASAAAAPAADVAGAPAAPAGEPGPPPPRPESPLDAGASPRPPGLPEKAQFLDLVGALVEPISIYLGDATLPDGKSAENLEVARFYIDLVEVLRDKTKGNLDSRETAFLDDLLYQLRMRYVQKTG